jgi:hypothetical protein
MREKQIGPSQLPFKGSLNLTLAPTKDAGLIITGSVSPLIASSASPLGASRLVGQPHEEDPRPDPPS